MANAMYNGAKQLMGRHVIGISQTAPTGVLRVGLVTSAYAFSQAHDFLDDLGSLSGQVPAALIASVAIGNATFNSRTLVGDNVSFVNLTGSAVVALLFYMHTGTASTSRLLIYQDTGITGMSPSQPLQPTGATVNLTWDAAGIFDL